MCGTTEQEQNKRTREETEKDYMERDIKKYSFPFRSIAAWNKLDGEVINARNIHDFKSKLENRRFDEYSSFFCMLQLSIY